MGRISSKAWSGVIGLPIVGFAFLWWAVEQWEGMGRMSGSTFQLPPTWRVLGWNLTLIAAGVAFGLAAGFARPPASKANTGVTAAVGVLPLTSVVSFLLFFWLEWSPVQLGEFGMLLTDKTTVVASCLVIGVLGAGLIAHRLVHSDRE